MTCTPPDLSIRSAHPRFTSARLVALSVLSVVLALGCGNDGSSGSGAANGNGATGGDGASSLLAVFYTIRSVDGQDTGYVNLTESLEGTLEIRDAVIEAPGNSTMYASPEIPNAFFIGSAEAPTITRYELSSDDTPIEVETVSFANFGLSRAPSFPGLAPILTADRAYAVDLNIGQLIEWNPTEMTVGDAINLGDLVREGLAPMAPLTVLVDDETVYIPVSWLDFDNQRMLPETLLLAVDTQTQEVHVHEDDRVIGIRGVYRTDSGEVFVASSDNFTAIFNRVGGEDAATAPGLLRVLDGARGYDPDFYVPLNDLAGGRPSQEVRPLPDGRLVFQSLHEDQAEPITETSTFPDVCLLQAWRYYTIDQAEVEAPGASATEVTAWPFTNCRTSFIEFEERLFFVDQSEDLDSATLVDFSNPQEPLATVTVPGPSVFFRSVARMR